MNRKMGSTTSITLLLEKFWASFVLITDKSIWIKGRFVNKINISDLV